MYIVLNISCKRFSLIIFFISCLKLHAQDFLWIFLVFFKKKFIFILNFDFKFPVQDGSKLGPFTLSPGHQRAGGNIYLCQQNLLFNLVFVHICLCILSYFHLMYLKSSFAPTAALARRWAGPWGDSGQDPNYLNVLQLFSMTSRDFSFLDLNVLIRGVNGS